MVLVRLYGRNTDTIIDRTTMAWLTALLKV